MSRIAVYPGTFDPITFGHIDIIERGAKLVDTLIVAVAEGTHKTPHFSWDERVELCQSVLLHLENVQVKQFDGLTVDFAHQHKANYILRGLRNVSDFDYEYQLAGMNHALAADMETIFLLSRPEHNSVSASIVREIVAKGGDVSAFVPGIIAKKLRKIF